MVRLNRSLVALALVLGGMLPLVVTAQTAPYCAPGEAPRFVFGFKALSDALGETMGEPLECEHTEPSTGDAHQQTSRGLAFYRKSTNTPTFTNGYEHWALTSRGGVYWTGDSIDPPGVPVPPTPAAPPPTPITTSVQPTPVPTPVAPASQPIQVQKVLWAPISAPYITVAALIRNPNPSLWMPTEEYSATAYDAAGTVLGSDRGYVSMGPGEERWMVLGQMTAPGTVARIDLKIRATKDFRSTPDPAPRLVITQSNFQPGQFSSTQVGLVKNEGAVEAGSVGVHVVYLDRNGSLMGTGVGSISNLKPGDTDSFRAFTSGAPLRSGTPADIKTYAYTSLIR